MKAIPKFDDSLIRAARAREARAAEEGETPPSARQTRSATSFSTPGSSRAAEIKDRDHGSRGACGEPPDVNLGLRPVPEENPGTPGLQGS